MEAATPGFFSFFLKRFLAGLLAHTRELRDLALTRVPMQKTAMRLLMMTVPMPPVLAARNQLVNKSSQIMLSDHYFQH